MEKKIIEEPVMHHVKDYFAQQPQTEFNALTDALEDMFRIREQSPRDVILFNKEGETDLAVYSVICSNLPLILAYGPGGMEDADFTDVKEVYRRVTEDKQKFISEVASKIAEFWDCDETTEWEMSIMAPENESEVFLLVNPSDRNSAIKEMESFNRDVRPGGYPQLSFDDELSMITGMWKMKYEDGGFFEKRKVRKANKSYDERFDSFISSIKPYLKKF